MLFFHVGGEEQEGRQCGGSHGPLGPTCYSDASQCGGSWWCGWGRSGCYVEQYVYDSYCTLFLNCVNIPPCATPPSVNHAPTVSIIQPKTNNLDPGTVLFQWNFSDPDAGDSQSRYVIDINCDKAGAMHFDNNSSNNSQTIGGFGNKNICSWTITAYDSGSLALSGSASANFSIKDAVVSLPSCSCGSVTSFCIGRAVTDSDLLCSPGNPSPSSSDIANQSQSAYQVNWTCSGGGCSGTANCSAKGQRNCGWIETNP